MNHYIYPVGLSVSMMCFILTFLLYSFLPQLRDLTGKFILGICSFMSIVFAAMLVDMFGWKDPNVEKLPTEAVLHGSIVGKYRVRHMFLPTFLALKTIKNPVNQYKFILETLIHL